MSSSTPQRGLTARMHWKADVCRLLQRLGSVLRVIGVTHLLAAAAVADPPESLATPWALSQQCPAGFVADGDNRCLLNSRYRSYPSPNDASVGGPRTGFREVREGFTAQQIDLGRYLFFDPVLSSSGTTACASCHNPHLGFSDGRATSQGMNDLPLRRSAPTLWNVGLLSRLQWDGSHTRLEEQMQRPLYSAMEMGNTPETLLERLKQVAPYPPLFQEAFGRTINLSDLYTALAAFQSSLISLNSRYDLYAHGYHAALSEQEIEGMNVFRSFVARCAECHTPPLFTNQQWAVIGVANAPGQSFDAGAEIPTGEPSLRGGFRVPTLRNIALTAPYMHAGQFDTLESAISFYNGGRGHQVPEGEDLKLHWHIWEPQLAPHEIESLALFLNALTDAGFMPVIPDAVPSGLEPPVTSVATPPNA